MWNQWCIRLYFFLPLTLWAQEDDTPSQMDKVGSIGSSLNLSANSTRSLIAVAMIGLFALIWLFYSRSQK